MDYHSVAARARACSSRARTAFSKREPNSERERSIEITLSPQMTELSGSNCKDFDILDCGMECISISMRKCDTTSVDIETKITTCNRVKPLHLCCC